MPDDEGFDGGGNDNGGDSGNVNPAWQEMLNSVPQEHHSQLIPHLKNWDQGVNTKLQGVHSQYEGYKQFVQQGVNPNDLQMGYGILQALNEDPAKVYAAIAEHYGLTQPNNDPDDEPEVSGSLPPEIMAKLQGFEQFQEQISRLMVAQKEEELTKVASDRLDKELSDLSAKYGEFDERIVLPLMQNGMAAEDAVKHYITVMDEAATKRSRPRPPKILGSAGGSIPQGGINPAQLSTKQVKDAIVQQLMASEQQ